MATADNETKAAEAEAEPRYEFEFQICQPKMWQEVADQIQPPPGCEVNITVRGYATEADALAFAARASSRKPDPRKVVRHSLCTEHTDPYDSVETVLDELAVTHTGTGTTSVDHKPKDILEIPFWAFAEIAWLCDDAHWESNGRRVEVSAETLAENGIPLDELIQPAGEE